MPYSDLDRKRRYQREWMAARRASYLDGQTCTDCGATEDLQVDHADPSTKVSHRIWSWSKDRLEAELAKCVVRCDRCHRDRHAALWQQHGTRKRYEKGCRCNLCAEASRVRSARIYAKRKEAA